MQGYCLRCMLKSLTDDPDEALEMNVPLELGQRHFGEYELLEELGRGGMGVVYRARQTRLNRVVALKVLLLGKLASSDFIQRFRSEAATAAKLRHPNLVVIYDTGEVQGEHYFSMDFVDGESLATLVREGPLPPRRAAEYLVRIAEAIQHAHDHGVIHRDLKPSNILIDREDQPRVTDFGLAKHLEDDSELTRTGQILGSPSYMPPEQAEGRQSEIGKASDVYALGAVLYCLITGRPPFSAATPMETLKLVIQENPIAPTRLNPSIPADLETICLRCLEKSSARRYPSARAFAEELGRFLRGEPIVARPVSLPTQLWRWGCRRPLVASLVGALLVVTLAGIGGVIIEWRRARAGELRAWQELYAADMTLAHLAVQRGQYPRVQAILERQIPQEFGRPDLRGWEWEFLAGQAVGDFSWTAPCPSSVHQVIHFDLEHKTLVVAGEGVGVATWGIGDGQVVTDTPAVPAHWRSLAWQDHQRACLGQNGQVSFMDEISGAIPWPALSISPQAERIIWSKTGKRLAALGATLTEVWNLETGARVARLETDGAAAGFSPDGHWLAVGERLGLVTVYDADTAQRRVSFQAHSQQIYSFLFGPTNRWLATGSEDGARFWSFPEGRLTGSLTNFSGSVRAIALSPDGRQFATCGDFRGVTLWDLASLQPIHSFRGPRVSMWDLAFSPDGKALASCEGQGSIWLWTLPAAVEKPQQLDLPEGTLGAVIAPDGSRLVTLHSDGTARFFDTGTLQELFRFSLMIPDILCGAAGPKAEWVATGSADGTLRLWKLEGGKVSVIAENKHPKHRIWTVTFDSTAHRLATADEFGVIRIFETPSLKPLGEWPFSGRGRAGLTFSGNGRWLVFASNEEAHGITTLIDLKPGGKKREFTTSPPDSFVFTQDEERLISAHNDGTIQVRSLPDGPVQQVVNSQVLRLTTVALSPEGNRIVAGAKDGTIVLWDAHTLHEVGTFRRSDHPIEELTFLPDRRTLITLSRDSLLQWPTRPQGASVTGSSRAR